MVSVDDDNAFIFDFEYDNDLLYQQFLKSDEYKMPYNDSRFPDIHVEEFMHYNIPTFDYAEELKEYFKVPEATPRFFTLDKNHWLPDHTDNGTQCALNFLINAKNPAPIDFNGKTYHYRSGLLNVSKLHAVDNQDEFRIIFKLAISKSSYEEVKERIRSIIS